MLNFDDLETPEHAKEREMMERGEYITVKEV
jgi:hypothetical protein